MAYIMLVKVMAKFELNGFRNTVYTPCSILTGIPGISELIKN